MATFFQFLPMLLAQQMGPQRLERTPEPEQITDGGENVVQYDRVMTTKLAIAYACGLMVVHRARAETTGGSAMDLACGPGHYTLCLARYLGYENVIGVDLAPPMVEVARRNAAEQRLDDRVQFRVGDVTKLAQVRSERFDLASFTDAAHHLPDLDSVAGVLREMDRIAKPDGLVMVMDLVRLRTAKLTERYVNTLGQDYVERGLPDFLEDFRNSMYAAWTAKELRRAIPTTTDRYWCHIVPRGLPTVQLILGLPIGRKKLFVRSSVPWKRTESPVRPEMKHEWKMLRLSLVFASRRLTRPSRGA